jgi:hypothetical protein
MYLIIIIKNIIEKNETFLAYERMCYNVSAKISVRHELNFKFCYVPKGTV